MPTLPGLTDIPTYMIALSVFFGSSVAEKTQSPALKSSALKVVDDDSNTAQNTGSPSPMRIEIDSRPHALARQPQQSVWFKALMRFGLYLMIAAFVIMGAEVAYALYQLMGLVL